MRQKKLRVGLIFGGKSGEHEVSLQSAKSIYEALDKNKYEVVLVGVDKQGQWHLGAESNYLLNASNPKLIALNKDTPRVTALQSVDGVELVESGSQKSVGKVDVFFPIIHGTFGQDGCLQGLLELMEVPYVGADVLGSAVGMDKGGNEKTIKGSWYTSS